MVERAWMLYDKRFSAFHYPVTDEDAPNYRSIIQNPMDMATMLQRVDSGQYITCSGFLQDIDLIVTNAKVYNGDDYNGARIVSRGYELRDAAIAAQGGPVQIPDDLGGSIFPSTPVVQLGTVTRTSARLRNVQPDVNLDQSYEALKRQKKNADATHAASTAEDKSRHQDSVQEKPPEEAGADDMNPDRPESSSADDSRHETSGGEASGHTEGSGSQDVTMSEAEGSSHVDHIKRLFVERTENYGIPLLERLYTRIMKGIFETKDKGVEDDVPRYSILRFLLKFAENTRDDSHETRPLMAPLLTSPSIIVTDSQLSEDH
nr:ATPase family AAA domain-containing protein At1g05910-like [Populus alba]